MMIKLVKPFLFVFLSILIIFACVKEGIEDNDSVQERILKAYIEVNYGDLQPTESGIYITKTTEGSGASISDSAYAYVNFSIRDLEKNYLSSTYDSIAEQLGTYHESNFYGPQVWFVRDMEKSAKEDSLALGLQEIVRMMKIGGKIEAILPPGGLSKEFGKQTPGEDSKIYNIELDTFVVNIKDYEIEMLEDYASKYYDGLDSLKEGFYFKKIHSGGYTEAEDSIPDEASLSIRYIGRLLDGTVFDTNIRDSAIKYNLYSGSDPSALSVTYYKDFKKAVEKNSLVEGFLLAIQEMGGYQDKCITFFDSDYGYKYAGNLNGNSGVPGYCPMFYEIWIDSVPKD